MERIIEGNLIITEENAGSYMDITAVTGKLKIDKEVNITLRKLTSAKSIELCFLAKLSAPVLVENEYIYFRDWAELSVPSMTSAGSISIEDSTLNAPNLTSVIGNLDIVYCKRFFAPNLKKIKGDIRVESRCILEFPQLNIIWGNISMKKYSTFYAPLLDEIIGDISLGEGCIFQIPKLKQINGNIYLKKTALQLPNLGAVIGSISSGSYSYLYAPNLSETNEICLHKKYNQAHKTLEKVGYLHVDGHFSARQLEKATQISIFDNCTLKAPVLKCIESLYLDKNAILKAPRLEDCVSFRGLDDTATLHIPQTKGLRHKIMDGSLFVIEAEWMVDDTNIYRGYEIERIENGNAIKSPCFVAEKYNTYAHATTEKEAIADLKFKFYAAKFKNEPIFPDTLITPNHYRAITGACKFGVKRWMHQQQIKNDSIRADELLLLLRSTNAYGLKQFESLLQLEH